MHALILTTVLFAQYDIDPQVLSGRKTWRIPPRLATPKPDPRKRKADRDACEERVGECCKALIESYGDPAVAALQTLSPDVGRQLCKAHTDGQLKRFAIPRELLICVGKKEHGDDTATWAMKHVEELADEDTFLAYVSEPLEYALGLQKLSEGAKRVGLQRKEFEAKGIPEFDSPGGFDGFMGSKRGPLYVGIGVVVVFAIWMWRRK